VSTERRHYDCVDCSRPALRLSVTCSHFARATMCSHCISHGCNVRPSVKSRYCIETAKRSQRIELVFFGVEATLVLSRLYVLCCTGIRVSPKIRMVP